MQREVTVVINRPHCNVILTDKTNQVPGSSPIFYFSEWSRWAGGREEGTELTPGLCIVSVKRSMSHWSLPALPPCRSQHQRASYRNICLLINCSGLGGWEDHSSQTTVWTCINTDRPPIDKNKRKIVRQSLHWKNETYTIFKYSCIYVYTTKYLYIVNFLFLNWIKF